MASRFKMFHVVLFITGVALVLTTIILTFLLIGLLQEEPLHGILFLISIALAIILFESFSFLSSSSAAPPACLDGFTVETNGGTGGAYTCTSLSP